MRRVANFVKMKRVNISVAGKHKALQKIEEEKTTKKSVAEEYGVKKNEVSIWITNRTKIIEAYESDKPKSEKV